MVKRQNIKTKISQTVQYWNQYVREWNLSIDWSEAETHCWRCGCERKLQRCHIIPDSLGGKDEPANIVLLCARCHADAPNVTDPEIMWDWIKAYNVPFNGIFWIMQGMKEYEFLYGKSVTKEMEYILSQGGIGETDKDREILQQLIIQEQEKIVKQASVHFGQPYFNTATMAGMYSR